MQKLWRIDLAMLIHTDRGVRAPKIPWQVQTSRLSFIQATIQNVTDDDRRQTDDMPWQRLDLTKYSRPKNIQHGETQQEAQLLLGDRATRKHAKDSWNWRGNDNLGWSDVQMYFKVIKSSTNRKLVYDFPLVVYINFCCITHRFWEIWCETVQWPWNIPKVIDSRITWKLSCGHVCEMFGRQWPNEPKIAIFYDPTLIWRPLSNEPPRISA